jgi:hypothetical protein
MRRGFFGGKAAYRAASGLGKVLKNSLPGLENSGRDRGRPQGAGVPFGSSFQIEE